MLPEVVLHQHSKLLELLNLLLPKNIAEQDKFSVKHFTRDRIFTVDILTFCILYLISDQNRFGYKHILQTLWKTLRKSGLALADDFGPSGAAFCKARKKLPAKIIKNMFNRVIELIDNNQPKYCWKGRRLFAIDGMKVQLPASPELREHFTCPSNQKGKSHYPQALLSKLCNVLTDVVYDFEIGPYNSNERELALLHLEKLRPSDLVLEDRGYPSYELYWEHQKRHIDFVMRMQINSGTIVDQFLESGKREQIMTIKMTYDAKQKYKNDTTVPKTLKVRLIRVPLKTGETEVLITSLLDMKKYPYNDFKTLYHWRWPIEEGNRSAKHHQFIENFHSKNINGIFQEINAHYLLMAITRLFMLQAEMQTPEKIYGLSYKSAVSFVSDELPILLLSQNKKILDRTINELLNMISNMYEKTRPERSFPRQIRAQKQRRFPVVSGFSP